MCNIYSVNPVWADRDAQRASARGQFITSGMSDHSGPGPLSGGLGLLPEHFLKQTIAPLIYFDAFCLKALKPTIYYLRIENAEGNVLIAVYLFIYLYICMRDIHITKKVLNPIAWNLVGWLVIIRGPFD